MLIDLYLDYVYLFLDTFPFIVALLVIFFNKGIPIVSHLTEDADIS